MVSRKDFFQKHKKIIPSLNIWTVVYILYNNIARLATNVFKFDANQTL